MSSKPLHFGENLPKYQAADQIQQLKSVGNQPRVGVLSPNVIANTNARAVSTPAHVQNVRVRVDKASDVSSRVTVTFKRDPTDYFFSHALVHVSGYKGNPAPTQIGSGQSPIVFALENTGEPVAVTVQSNGNLGPAPLQTAPSATLQLRNAGIVTTSTTQGNGITPAAITQIQAALGNGTNGLCFFGPGLIDSNSALGTAVLGNNTPAALVAGVATANVVTVYKFTLPFPFLISKVTTQCTDNFAGHTATFGIYSAAGALVLDGGQFTTLGSGGIVTNTIAPVTLAAGVYWHAQAANTTVNPHFPGITVLANSVMANYVRPILTANSVKAGTAANPLSSGALPATLGAITGFTPSSANGDGICCPLYE